MMSSSYGYALIKHNILVVIHIAMSKIHSSIFLMQECESYAYYSYLIIICPIIYL